MTAALIIWPQAIWHLWPHSFTVNMSLHKSWFSWWHLGVTSYNITMNTYILGRPKHPLRVTSDLMTSQSKGDKWRHLLVSVRIQFTQRQVLKCKITKSQKKSHVSERDGSPAGMKGEPCTFLWSILFTTYKLVLNVFLTDLYERNHVTSVTVWIFQSHGWCNQQPVTRLHSFVPDWEP